MDDQTKRQEIERLTKQIREGSNADAFAAVSELRARGWLTDGSLKGATLSLAASSRRGASAAIGIHRAFLSESQPNLEDLLVPTIGRADLKGADLSYAVLNEVILTGAILEETNLFGANLDRALLTGANLSRALFTKTNLTNAFCGETIFADVNLSTVMGLETIEHWGPSHVDADTLYRSGPLPLEFLRGVGLPDDLITYLPSLTGKAIEFYSAFISYSHADADFARRLHDRLQGAGIRCWLDQHEVNPGDKIIREVERGIRIWDKVLLCCSEASLQSWWVDKEITYGLGKEEELSNERGEEVLAIIPLDLDGHLFGSYAGEYKALLRARNAANFTDWKNHDAFEREVRRVIRALRTDGGKLPPPEPRL